MTADNLGVLSNLATALGLFQDGDPNPDWFGHPDDFLKTMLAEQAQRDALIAFVDDALGGADRTTDTGGAVWLPIVSLQAPDPPLDLAVTIDDNDAESVALGLGIAVRTTDPTSRTTLQIPLFRGAKSGGHVDNPFLLGQVGGRIRIATTITVDSTPPVPGRPRLGSIGIDLDVPTTTGDDDPVFGLTLAGLQLPGATAPRDIRISADGADELDDAVLDLVLSLVRAQAEGAAGTPLGAVAGMLGLVGTDAIPDFPIQGLATQGITALAQWLHDLLTVAAQRDDWIGYLADLLGVTADGDAVEIEIGAATVRLGVRVETGPSGNPLVTPTLTVSVGDAAKRVEARADICRIDLVAGAAFALPSFGVLAAVGAAGVGNRVLDLTSPTVARADTLRVGFAVDAARQLTFVLAADKVVLGTHEYPTLDLTSPDAVMDAAGNAAEDVADELLGTLADALGPARVLLGLDAPPGTVGVPTVSLTDLLTDPVGAVAGHWQELVTNHRAAVPTVLEVLRDALADTVAATHVIRGTGTRADPWRLDLIRPLELQVWTDGDTVSVDLAANTFVDDLGQQCTVIETRIAATIAEVDLAHRTASLLTGVEARLLGRERGIVPSRALLPVEDGVAIQASYVGIRLGWSAISGLEAAAEFPDLALLLDGDQIPIVLPTIGADGNVALPPEGWDAVQSLVTSLAGRLPDFVGDITDVLGWTGDTATSSKAQTAALRLADLVDDPAQALSTWLAGLAVSELAPKALTVLADLLSATGSASGRLLGSGHPDDPFRLDLQPGVAVPELVVWFPPAGLLPRVTNAPESIRNWRPGQPGLPPGELAHALGEEAVVARDVAELIEGRDLVTGLATGLGQLGARWVGGDGRIVPPVTTPAGVTVGTLDCAAGQLLAHLDLDDQLGRTPTTTVYVALGSAAWPDAPADRRIDLTAVGLAPSMFTGPGPATGDWFVALGERAVCRLGSGDDDGTLGQAARLRVVLDALAPLGTDTVLVGLAGAGHACRLAADGQPAVSDVVTLGTPLGPVSVTALTTQPVADAWRLLHRVLPTETDADDEAPDADLDLARSLVGALLELSDRADPTSELRPPTTAPAPPRSGLTVTALFGVVSQAQVSRAMTSAVAAGLAERARARAQIPLPPATGIRAGFRFAMPATTTGSLMVQADCVLTVFGYDTGTGLVTGREVRVRAAVGDRLGWLTATPDLELRRISVDAVIPLGAGPGTATVTLHDARVFGQSWERLVLGTGPGAVPLLPEARVLLSAAVQRLTADAAGTASEALAQLLQDLGLVAGGGAVFDAFDQLIHDPGGLVRDRLAAAAGSIQTTLGAILGPLASTIDLDARKITFSAGSDTTGRFGWHGTAILSPTGLGGTLTFGAATPSSPAGALQLVVDLSPFTARLHWQRPGSGDDVIELWPSPDGDAIARVVATAAPSLGGHAALELMRAADAAAKPLIDAALDALGLLGGAVSDPDRPLRPLAGLLADPAGWLRSAESLAASPAKIQGLFDALRPLLGVAGGPGDPWQLADGVRLAVVPQGGDARLELTVDASDWTAPAAADGRVGAGITAGVTVGADGPPGVGLDVYVGLPDADPGRQAVHASLAATGAALFVRPATGADISLVPFAGLGGLAEAAAKALPFLLDKLAADSGEVGDVVSAVGDALALRTTSAPKHFDEARLAAWATDPVAALTSAVPSIVSIGLTALAPLVDDLVPAAVTVTATPTQLTATVGAVSLSWAPFPGRVTLGGADIPVPGIEHLTFAVAVSGAGLDELSVTIGPAAIQADTATLRPYVTVAGGNAPVGGRRVLVGMAVDDTHRFAARWLLDSHQFALVASDGPIAVPVDDAGLAALRAVEVVADLVVAVAMATDAVGDLLETDVFDSTVRDLLAGVVLDAADPTTLIEAIFDPATLMARIQRLFENIAAANVSFTVDGQLTISLKEVDDVIGLEASLAQRWPLVEGDVSLWLENDDSWIDGNPAGPGGLFVGFLDTSAGLAFKPSLGVYGVGLRVGKMSGPLLDVGLTLESVALHVFAELDMGGARSGGVQLQLTNLGVSASGASGGNGIAAGIMRDTGSQPPQPAFSPALAIQQHGTDPVEVTLRAGDGEGPWWIAIQKGFGPLYLEQVGLGVVMPNHRVDKISLLMDGSVSMFGLTCAVDDLQITYLVSKNDFFNPGAWDIDLAGLAVSADMAGLTIAGGLLKQQTGNQIEYLGMLLARFGVYGITIYGGYGEGEDQGQKFVAFFAVGSIVGPIGGPPAFFLTGIGGGFGINRALVVPTDLSRFGDYPLIKALDVAAKPGNPMDELRALGTFFPMKRGSFWFAAGLSFNSFALVDGIAVVAVEVGDGLDINLLGLARMALPRPQVAIVSIEIALLVRFSSSEGVLWVQGQLTDNSWLLYPDVRLTGGFAFVTWFKGEYRGQFVLTLGGYHPEFKKPGYPQVPRLGLRWGFGDNIVVEAGSYFALTSEAVMAGGDFVASASFGPAWAVVRFGAHGIIYFDPFRYQVMVYASIDAGVTIDTWLFGEITISVHIGARIEVEGPDFHGKATLEVGPVEITVEIGSSEQTRKDLLAGDAFVTKYLEPTSDGAATLSIITTFGTQPSGGDKPTPDGTPDRPYVVVAEFGLIITSTVPLTDVTPTGGMPGHHAPTRVLGVAPMGTPSMSSTLQLSWQHSGTELAFPFHSAARPFGAFPLGVWGPPQDDNNRKTPTGDVVEALSEVSQAATASISAGGPEIPYYQVEIGARLPLPFKRPASEVAKLRADAKSLSGLVKQPTTTLEAFATARTFLAASASPTALAAFVGERQAPPRAGTLGEGLDTDAITVIPDIQPGPTPDPVDAFVDPPIAVGLLSGGAVAANAVPQARTTVRDASRLWRTAPPTIAVVDAERSRSFAATLVLNEPVATATLRAPTKIRGSFDSRAASRASGSVIATGSVPTTAAGHAPSAAIARVGNASNDRLRGFESSLTARRRTRSGDPGATLQPGDVVVLRMPNAHRDVGAAERPALGIVGAPARAIAVGPGGAVLADTVIGDALQSSLTVAGGTERLVVIGLGDEAGQGAGLNAGLDGWHSGALLPYLGWSSAVGRGCTVRALGEGIADHRERLDAGWVTGAELARGLSTVTTRFSGPVRTVLIALDDPTAFGGDGSGRRLLLGLDGATRVRDAAGNERPPVLLTSENRSVLAYDVAPSGDPSGDTAIPVTVTIASEQGWSLVAVMGSADLGAEAAISLVTGRGLDAALRPLAPGNTGTSRLVWLGETRPRTRSSRKAAR